MEAASSSFAVVGPRLRRALRLPRRVLAVLALLPALLPCGCGEPDVGGSGRLETRGGKAWTGPGHLVVAGSPYQMGYWQGRLLAARIRRLHARWQAAAFGRGEKAATLRSACLLYTDQTLRRLPEPLRQELDGMAAGSGVDAEILLLTEVLRDGLRYHGVAPALPGHLACVVDLDGSEARCRPGGADLPFLVEEALLVERRPEAGPATLLVAWPGSLGGVAGVASSGLAAVSAQVGAPLEHQRMGVMPFTVALRRALEKATDAEALVLELGGTVAHRVLALDAEGPRAVLGLAAIAGTVSADLSALSFFELPPEGEAGEVLIPAEAAPPGPDPLAAALGAPPAAFYGVRVRRTAAPSLTWSRDGASREVRLEGLSGEGLPGEGR